MTGKNKISFQISMPLTAAVLFLFLHFSSSAVSAPPKNADQYYKKLLSIFSVQRYKYDQEIGKPTFMTIQEEEQYKKGLFKGVKISATLETKEMLDAYVESEREDGEMSDEEAAELQKSLYEKYHIQDKLCFLLYMDNTSARYNYLEINNAKDNILLVLPSGSELKPVEYDKELEGLIQRKISGLVCYPKEDAKGNPLLSEKVKWLKLRLVRVFPMDASYAFHESADFEFVFEVRKFFKAVKEGVTIIKNPLQTVPATKNTPPQTETKDDPVSSGLQFVREGKLDDAIALFKEAIDQSPDDVSLYILLGSTYLKKDLYDAAISLFKQAVEINPLSSLTHYHLGVAYREKKEYEKAVVEFKQAVAAQEDYKEAYYIMGMTFMDLGLTDDAKYAFQKALDIDISFERARLQLDKLK